MYFAKDYLRTLFLRLPLEMKAPFYVVIRAKRRSSRSLGKGSNFISQIFLIKTLTTGPAARMNYTHDLSLCSQARYQLSLSCCRGLVFFYNLISNWRTTAVPGPESFEILNHVPIHTLHPWKKSSWLRSVRPFYDTSMTWILTTR